MNALRGCFIKYAVSGPLILEPVRGIVNSIVAKPGKKLYYRGKAAGDTGRRRLQKKPRNVFMERKERLNLSMLFDFYEMTMANGYFRQGM